jgi:hypothetical protein
MVDHTRAHERIEEREYPGTHLTLDDILPQPVEIYIPEKSKTASNFALLVHFHGPAHPARHAVHTAPDDYAAATVHLGAGSLVYEKGFATAETFPHLLASIKETIARHIADAHCTHVYLSAFSAGYGAAGRILNDDDCLALVDGLILLDGLHTGYFPERVPLAAGSRLEPGELAPFLNLAILAVKGEKKILFTHSEVFPGTYASTTECADHILHLLQLKRDPVLEWGPLGMQLLSRAHQGNFTVLGFAGNSAPDHMDHLHGLYHFLKTF